ncbi:hypothetical protein LOTGIDRAFT_154968 [Lottia gigantea]|uniref:Uncharacterized protein n=1 Tax=Lottia gigantea TaxID=225164 RepID=V3Z490_LOTGI|nr:hypothetical protein LOTGIDRAFT_154968 [Lottia gigantea]ESO85478.1 hypothetical protein LOTGIDRAFT_154968 [Lottia gigantea]
MLTADLNCSKYCPVNNLLQYCRKPQRTSGPLFSFMDGSSVSRSFLTNHLDLALKFCNLPTSVYKSHSFRNGAANLDPLAMLALASENARINEEMAKLILEKEDLMRSVNEKKVTNSQKPDSKIYIEGGFSCKYLKVYDKKYKYFTGFTNEIF